MKKLFISAIALSTLVSSLYAGGKLVEPPQVPPIPIVTDIWSGPYLGAQLGFISGKGTAVVPAISVNKVLKPSGLTAGIFGGYNFKTKNDILLGFEGDINYISADKSINDLDSGNNFTLFSRPTINYKLKQYWDASLRIRVGKVIDNKYLPYVTAGAAWTKIGTNYPGTASPYSDVKKKTLSGWTVGAGVEVKINRNVNARVQYRYSDYGTANFTHGAVKSSIKNFKTHSVRAGISYSFN